MPLLEPSCGVVATMHALPPIPQIVDAWHHSTSTALGWLFFFSSNVNKNVRQRKIIGRNLYKYENFWKLTHQNASNRLAWYYVQFYSVIWFLTHKLSSLYFMNTYYCVKKVLKSLYLMAMFDKAFFYDNHCLWNVKVKKNI